MITSLVFPLLWSREQPEKICWESTRLISSRKMKCEGCKQRGGPNDDCHRDILAWGATKWLLYLPAPAKVGSWDYYGFKELPRRTVSWLTHPFFLRFRESEKQRVANSKSEKVDKSLRNSFVHIYNWRKATNYYEPSCCLFAEKVKW